MKVRIYRPAKTAMQSGEAKTHKWMLESVPNSPKIRDPLMGWTGTSDMNREWHLTFPTKEDAIAFAEHRDLAYEVEEAHERKIRPKSYAANFRWDRPAG